MIHRSRRAFIRTATLAGAGLAVLPSSLMAEDEPEQKRVRLGLIGVGLRGQHHLALALQRNDTDVVAICDIDQRMIDMCKEIVSRSERTMPEVIIEGPYGYRKLLERDDIDAVIISTPWEWHTVMCIDSMRSKKYTGCEVITGTTVEECWDLVKTSEETGMPLMMLENVCYRRDVMAIMNMVRQNIFGELIHLQGGYQHDLREVKFNDGQHAYGHGVEFGDKGFSEARWRTHHSVHRNGDLYPTHGIGPLAMMIDVNRGNRFTELVSYASKSRGLHEHIVKHGGRDHPNAAITFNLGDVVTSMIRTVRGETILLQHDTNLPRPYSLGFRVQGTNGIWMDLNNGIYLEGKTENSHRWEDATRWLEKYDHPLWQKYGTHASGSGHGGMDWFVLNAFIEAVKRNAPTPQDVYDAVTWSAITPLSERSIRLGGETIAFPDFTRGKWMYRENNFARNDEY